MPVLADQTVRNPDAPVRKSNALHVIDLNPDDGEVQIVARHPDGHPPEAGGRQGTGSRRRGGDVVAPVAVRRRNLSSAPLALVGHLGLVGRQ